MKKILFVYRTPRKYILDLSKKGQMPDSLLFGANHLEKMGFPVDFFDYAFSPFNIFHSFFYLLEHSIINKTGMGFKLDQAVALLPQFKKYDVIVATGDSAGLPILALKHYGLIKKPVIFMTAGLAGALSEKTDSWVADFYRRILNEADVFTSYSQVEIEFFENKMDIRKGKIKYIPLGTDWGYFSKRGNLKREIISAVGIDSGRDYKTLFEAVGNLPVQVEVACHPSNVKDLKIPQNVTVRFNVPIQEVKAIFDRSLISIVPCFERNRSAGQMVLLESSSASLPVIASRIKGITGAFKFEDNKHLLFVKPQDSDDLRGKIEYLLKNREYALKLGQNASKLVKNNYTTKHLAKNLTRFIDKL